MRNHGRCGCGPGRRAAGDFRDPINACIVCSVRGARGARLLGIVECGGKVKTTHLRDYVFVCSCSIVRGNGGIGNIESDSFGWIR